ncbi:MAG TPA: hypothetical protein DEQ43_08545 [Nocardioides bacterium]|uniref:hypothetical protein n=1 Tax=uncultured Nocardioides sp. TaxID=198441 RepID=UPI000EEA71C7|nr:hypothetical protein [uncultured Nocardioides sp.]HCB04279.1 hypothetical protein [Nocardioides sp.]HRD63467.1 hypothetical protein [Nocardioides sp.]
MSGRIRVLAFVAGCAALFAVAVVAGRLVGPVAAEPDPAAGHDDEMAGMEMVEGAHHDVGGLEASAGGYTMTLTGPRQTAGRQPLAFTITDADGDPVTAYDEQHERDLHLIVVRRDLTGFQHVHPTLATDTGEWSTEVELSAGAWRVLTDFQPSGGEPQVLGADLLVEGDFAPAPLGPDSRTAHVDGYDVTLGRERVPAGTETVLTTTISRAGEPVTDLQPYLGASGHLVVLREGDLGYLHVHPDEESGAGPAIAFHTTFPSPGRYRLFLDFRHGDEVRTATFTVTVESWGDGTGHDH